MTESHRSSNSTGDKSSLSPSKLLVFVVDVGEVTADTTMPFVNLCSVRPRFLQLIKKEILRKTTLKDSQHYEPGRIDSSIDVNGSIQFADFR